MELEDYASLVTEADACFAAADVSGGIRVLIEGADRFARAAKFAPAIALFKAARTSLTERQDPARLTKSVSGMRRKLADERERFREAILKRAPPEGQRLLIFADSLGLPRPEEAELADGGIGATYTGLIQAQSRTLLLPNPIQVIPHCQRYLNSSDVLGAVVAGRASLTGAIVLVHVGLNDCWSRTFSEAERVAVSLLDQKSQNLLMQFVRRYRHPIIHHDPEYNYTDLSKFTRNLEKIIKVARTNGSKQVILSTIIQPGRASERHTPHLRWNFSRYNLAIYDIVKRFSARLIDVDRMFWDRGLAGMMFADGIHLSAKGHLAFANECLSVVEDIQRADQTSRGIPGSNLVED
ncbi:SGNH/GDSL hydrolase family protein [Methylorubrum extorquens]|uniref:SGNH hydrolase-type esterase domain-containing protein n=1 Tax=Methylorubrum extorquens (strain CM4 / NCIMB 13688) TaxID=440085 RepID=B7KYN1_METC4|nr:SGNH/GDSL hydrolase family protein [Methylorubrum extorquens]ACK84782.1 hypothetical protein Mchl_3977 [Methylorubrum extorquens CM4]